VFRQLDAHVVLAQTRGDNFVHACLRSNRKYEVDTVLVDGSIQTDIYEVAGVGTLGNVQQRSIFMKLPQVLKNLTYIGVGVTEAGIDVDSQAMEDLSELLYNCYKEIPGMCAKY